MQALPEGWQRWDRAELEAAVAEHNRRYWDDADPLISDYDYDRLVERLREVAPDSPVLQAMGPSADRVGSPVRHVAEMLSLDKCYDEETLHKWAEKFEGSVVMTPKVDGVACSIRYDHAGVLVVAATRGNGRVGEDITENVRRIADVPVEIPHEGGAEVRGEVYMPITQFVQLEGDFANPRNTAAGALKQKDADRSQRMGLRFFAYDVVGPEITTETDKFALAERWGFQAVEHRELERDAMQAGYEEYVQRREQLDFEIDGVVYKANRLDEQDRMGATAHHPRYAIAYKLQGDSATTTLRDVEWSVSRSGILTPVGIVEPVKLSGATVTRISLHNWGLVQSKKLSINAQVVAMRRGGVIPYLETVVEPGDVEIVPPEKCPSCDAEAKVEGDLVICTNPKGCRATSVGELSHYAKAVDLDGFGAVWLETLFDAGLLVHPPDFYALKAIDLLEFDRMGETLANKLISNIDKTRAQPLASFLTALGIGGLGRTVSRSLARNFETLERVREVTADELIKLDGYAEISAGRIVRGLQEKAELIDALLDHVTVQPDLTGPDTVQTEGPWTGKSFLFTATLASMKRDEAKKRVEALGGKNASSVNKSLDYLVVGNEGKAGSKLQKAEKAGVEVVPEDRFVEMLAEAEGE